MPRPEDDISEFGITHNHKYYRWATIYRMKAIKDGWKIRPTYEDESMYSASRLTKDGFVMSILSRDKKREDGYYQCSIYIWGPDELAVRPPDQYSMEEILKNYKRCNYCGKEGKLQRVGFAGRCCSACLAVQKKIQEFPGWTS